MIGKNIVLEEFQLKHITVFITVLGILFSAYAQEDIPQKFSYDDYVTTLKTFVNNQGMVNYKDLKANREELDAFVSSIGKLNPQVYEKWDEKEKIAFLINAYNGLTLKVIVDNYPIKSSFLKSRIYPKNSIRQIKGVWDKIKFNLIGKEKTLDQIEHKILRKEFNEPRIHMALVCAAMGCPALRNEPYTGDKLATQLDDQTERFLKDPEKFRIDRDDGELYLSSIFKWFGEDFIKTYGTYEKFSKYDEKERAVLNQISKYLEESDQEYLETGDYKIKYLDYDWSLNEQK